MKDEEPNNRDSKQSSNDAHDNDDGCLIDAVICLSDHEDDHVDEPENHCQHH